MRTDKALREGAAKLMGSDPMTTGSDPVEARGDARRLLCHVTGWTQASVLAYPERELDAAAQARYAALLARRARHEPVAYLIGEAGFYGRTFAVSSAVLIPRPDTELLVEQVLLRLPKVADKPLRVLDVGTGSGCIPITLLLERPDLAAVAADISDGALGVASENARRHGVTDRLALVRWDMRTPPPDLFGDRFDVIVSNPPYITTETVSTLMPDVRDHEPRLALDGGADGLVFYRRLTWLAQRYLSSSGFLAVETGYDQGESVCALFSQAGFAVRVERDLEGRNRVVLGWRTDGG